jgi:hypothetical protein
MPRSIYFIVMLLFTAVTASSQEEKWDVYMAQYEKGPGSTLINMGLKDQAPVKQFPFLLKAGIKMLDCSKEGLPTDGELKTLHAISDTMKSVITSTCQCIEAGTFSYQCNRTDYYYIEDTVRIRDRLEEAFKKYFPQYESLITVKPDSAWEAYLTFLYPNEETQEYMSNEKVVGKLVESGDDLSQARQVNHWLYFKTERERGLFLVYAQKDKFKLEAEKYSANSALPYSLQISRNDKVDLASISAITLRMRRKAKELNGDYDGWETFVIKSK